MYDRKPWNPNFKFWELVKTDIKDTAIWKVENYKSEIHQVLLSDAFMNFAFIDIVVYRNWPLW